MLLPSGKVLLMSSTTDDAALALYAPSLNTQTPAGNLIQSRSFHAVTRMNSGKILVTGGNNGTNITTEIYDPEAGLSSYTASMPESRYHHTATLLPSGKVLVAGGVWSGTATATATVVLYTP